MFGHTKVQYFYKFRSEGWKENFPCVHILTGKIFFVLQGILFSLLGSCSHYRNLSACPLLYPVQDCNVTLQVRFGELSQVPCIFSKFSKTDLQRHCESGNPPRVPRGVLGPPSPQRTPLDPLGVCRCWGYNFRLGNLFYYYEKTWIRETLPGSPGAFLEPLKDPLGPPGTPWDPLGPPGTPWDPVGPRGTPWDPLGPPGTPWDYNTSFLDCWWFLKVN